MKIKPYNPQPITHNLRPMTKNPLPITLPGLAIFIISLVILIRSLSARNLYEILLSGAALLFLIVLGFVGGWAVRRLKTLESMWKAPYPLTAASDEEWLLGCPLVKLPAFFRFHFLVRGFFQPQGAGIRSAVFAEASFPRKGDTANLRLTFPLGGHFQGEGSLRLRDVFGLFSFKCGVRVNQVFNVRSASCDFMPLRIDARSGAEDRRTRSSSDEERYYMREYAPGDRLRDINWKSSGRIDTLITRISPDNQEKITRIDIHFRNYGPSRPSLGDLWLLDRAKARLGWFLRNVKDENASFVFDVHSADRSWELGDQEAIDTFLDELSAIPFAPAGSGASSQEQAKGAGEICVFSTACDAGLPAFMLARQGRPVSLFMVQGAPQGEMKYDNLRLRDFPAQGFVPMSRAFFFAQKKLLNISAARMHVDYARLSL